MVLTQKETMFLQDLKAAEQTCVDRYTRFAAEANDGTLKNLFQTILKKEQHHLELVNQLLQGVIPQIGGESSPSFGEDKAAETNTNKEDKFLCNDALDSEKHASSLYNTSIFEFKNSEIRNILNHIQKEEQEHGDMLYKYMQPRGLYGCC